MPRHTVSLAELATSLSEDVEFAALVEIPPERIDQVGQALQLLREEATDWKPAMGSEDPASITAAEALPHAQADEGATHTAMAIYRQMATVLPYHDVVEEGCPPISLGALELTFHFRQLRDPFGEKPAARRSGDHCRFTGASRRCAGAVYLLGAFRRPGPRRRRRMDRRRPDQTPARDRLSPGNG